MFDFSQHRNRRGFTFVQRTNLQSKDAIRAVQLQNILCSVFLSVFILYAIYSVCNDSIILHSCLPFRVEANSTAIEPLEYFPGADWWSSRRCHLPLRFREAVSKKHAKISSRKSKQVPSNNIALFTLPKPNLGR